MKFRYLFMCVLCLTVLYFSKVQAQQNDRESARSSVVKIQTSYHKNQNGKVVKEVGTATGWCWKDPTLVVTALHAVTGSDKITVFKAGAGSTTASIEKVLKEADLALLRLSSPLGLVPLQSQDVGAGSMNEYYVWGFPHAVFTMQGDDIRFARSADDIPTLNTILTGNKLKNELETQGYPLPKARILLISSTIQPGHSGAPIMTKSGTVIGIADGGLRGGTARINWAMPAGYYLPLLAASKDLIPREPSLQVSLYSSTTIVEEDATEEEEIREIEKEAIDNTIVNGSQSIVKTWSATYDEILGTLSESDRQAMMEISSLLEIDMSDKKFDIYEDFNTGATISVPFGEDFSVRDGWFFVCNEDQTLYYDALPFDSETYENAKSNAIEIFAQNFPEDQWGEVPGTPDNFQADDELETASITLTRSSLTGNNQEVYFNAQIDGPVMLVSFIVYDKERMLQDTEYIRQYLHYALAMNMGAFATY